MKISIERATLLKAVGQAQSVVERRNTIPILANVLMEAEGSTVSFRATDLDIEVVDKAPAQVERAGATTVAELACIGRPALFVPFPHAADDHQTANAAALVAAGAAAMEREAELDEARLVARLRALLTDAATLADMGAKARALGQPNAAADIAADLRALAGGA